VDDNYETKNKFVSKLVRSQSGSCDNIQFIGTHTDDNTADRQYIDNSTEIN